MVNALGMMHTTPEALILSPIYHVFDFYTNHTGRTVLDASVVAEDDEARETLTANIACAVYGRPTPPPRYEKNVRYVDAVATLDGAPSRPTRVSIAALNRHEMQPAKLRVDLGPLPRSGGAIFLHELTGPDGLQQNTVEQPDAVSPTTRKLDKWPETLTLAPRSVTILEWTR
jgi:alpha-L-arabinofuranosidase